MMLLMISVDFQVRVASSKSIKKSYLFLSHKPHPFNFMTALPKKLIIR